MNLERHIRQARQLKADYKNRIRYHVFFTKVLVDNFLTKDLPRGYIGFGVGPKGERGDWGELCKTFPIIIFMLTLMVIGTLIGLAFLHCQRRHKFPPRSLIHHRKKYRVRCCVIRLAMFVLLFFMAYSLGVSIASNIDLLNFRTSPKRERARSIHNILNNNYEFLLNYTDYASNELVKKNMKEIMLNLEVLGNDSVTTGDAISNIVNGSSIIIDDINQLYADFTEWSDFMRNFHREIIRNYLKSGNASEILEYLDFKTFYVKSLHLDTLLNIERAVFNLRSVFNEIQNNLIVAREFPGHLSNEVKKAALAYRNNITKIFNDKGNQIHAIEHRLERTSTENKDKYRKMYLTQISIILGWIGNFAALLILIVLLLAIISHLRIKDEKSRDKTIWLLKFLNILIVCLYLFIGLSVIWHLFYGTVLYNGPCLESYRIVKTAVNIWQHPSPCEDEKSVFNDFVSVGIADKDHKINLPPVNTSNAATYLSGKLPDFSNTSELIDEKLQAAIAPWENPTFCDELKTGVDMRYLFHIYTNSHRFAISEMNSEKPERRLSLCLLYRMKVYRIDPFPKNDFSTRINRVIEFCEKIAKHFEKDGDKIIEDTLQYMHSMQSFYKTASNTKQILDNIVNDLSDLYRDEWSDYVHSMGIALDQYVGKCITSLLLERKHEDVHYDLCTQYGLALLGVWSGLFWILIMLIPIPLFATLLIRLYPSDLSQQSVAAEAVIPKEERADDTPNEPSLTYINTPYIQSGSPTNSLAREREICTYFQKNGLQSIKECNDRVYTLPPAPGRKDSLLQTRSSKSSLKSKRTDHRIVEISREPLPKALYPKETVISKECECKCVHTKHPRKTTPARCCNIHRKNDGLIDHNPLQSKRFDCFSYPGGVKKKKIIPQYSQASCSNQGAHICINDNEDNNSNHMKKSSKSGKSLYDCYPSSDAHRSKKETKATLSKASSTKMKKLITLVISTEEKKNNTRPRHIALKLGDTPHSRRCSCTALDEAFSDDEKCGETSQSARRIGQKRRRRQQQHPESNTSFCSRSSWRRRTH